GHGLPVDIALPEVTGDDADEVVPELDDDGLVEAVLAAEFGDLRRGHRPFLRDLEHGVAGQHSEGEEAEDDDEDHRGRGPAEVAQEVASERSALRRFVDSDGTVPSQRPGGPGARRPHTGARARRVRSGARRSCDAGRALAWGTY